MSRRRVITHPTAGHAITNPGIPRTRSEINKLPQPARPPDPGRHPGDGIRPQLATAGITPQDTRLTAPPVGRPPRAALQPRPWLERIKLYRPGLHSDSDDGSLASNESPVGASAGVVTAITGAALQAHRYPDPLAGALRAELAALHGVHPDQIPVGNGSDELIFPLAWAYLAQQGHAVCADPLAHRRDQHARGRRPPDPRAAARLGARPRRDGPHRR
jgi:hypothetical protein